MECHLYPSPLFPRRVLQRHELNQLNGHAPQTQFWFSVSPAELSRSALVTSVLTLSFSLMWTQGGRLRHFGANPGSGAASLNTCSKRCDLEQSSGVVDSYSHNFLPLFSPVNDNLFVRLTALLNNSYMIWLDFVASWLIFHCFFILAFFF